MPLSNEVITASLLATTLASMYIIYNRSKHRTQEKVIPRNRKRKGLWDGQAIWSQMRQVMVVNNMEDCERAVSKLLKATNNVKVLGLDCEWCSVSGKSNRVALLQLAAANGVCVLIQLNHMTDVPQNLKDLLADRSILKVGVGVIDDGLKLHKDYGMITSGCIDLRYVAVRHVSRDLRPSCYGAGLGRLASILLGVTIDKSYRLRCSNWEAQQLTWQQMKYAVHDAFVAVAIFFEIVDSKVNYNGDSFDSLNWSSVLSLCQGIVDVKFKSKNVPSELGEDNHQSPRKRNTSQVGASKPLSKAYVSRKSIMYHNCKLIAPDGTLLCSCDRKKAEWYIHKDIGVVECEEPFTVRLKFEPKGVPGPDRQYYLRDKENKCVVCGRDDSYVRKNIVPHEYKRHFPEYLKNHSSHDTLLMCLQCHQTSWSYDSIQRQQLVSTYNAPISTVNSPTIPDQEKSQVRSHAKGLLRHQKTKALPEERIIELEKTVKDFYEVDVITQDLLEQASQIQTKKVNKDFTGSHGEKVVTTIIQQEGVDGLLRFEKEWRQKFLDCMKPKYLPDLWSVDHVHESAERKIKELKELDLN